MPLAPLRLPKSLLSSYEYSIREANYFADKTSRVQYALDSRRPTLSLNLPPYVYALIAAFLFAVGAQLQAVGLAGMDSRNGTALGIASSAICFWLVAPWFLEPSYFFNTAILLFIGIGLIRPAISANLGTTGIRFLGPTLSGTLSSTGPVFGVALGVFWLGEKITAATAFGTAGIVGAIILLSRQRSDIGTNWPVWALMLPIGAAIIRSFGHAVNKVGMGYIPDPYFATLIGFTTSALVTLSVQATESMRLSSQGKSGGLTLQGSGALWFMVGGIVYAIAVLSLNQALLIGEVVTVVPIVSCNPVFTMLLSVFVFQRETINFRTLLALALVLPSVVLVVILG